VEIENMTCGRVIRFLPGYLDGALPESLGSEGHAIIGAHLETCPSCRRELERYRRIQRMMSVAERPSPPTDLGSRILIAVSNARAFGGFAGRLRRAKDRLELLLENIFEPLALPATGGIVAALLVFAVVYQILGPGMPVSAATPDSPTNLLQPARLEALAGFQMSQLEEMTRTGGQHPLLVEAMVNADGQAVSYRVISGQVDVSMQRELDQVLFFSRFRPEMSFGRPTSGGRVILSFSQIRVRG
jgi:anti-sigma factor RsiW